MDNRLSIVAAPLDVVNEQSLLHSRTSRNQLRTNRSQENNYNMYCIRGRYSNGVRDYMQTHIISKLIAECRQKSINIIDTDTLEELTQQVEQSVKMKNEVIDYRRV